jgi:hypothetical protein
VQIAGGDDNGEREREEERAEGQNGTDGRAPYCVIRVPTTLTPLCPCGTIPRSRWIPRALSLAPCYAPRAPGWMTPYALVQK